MSDQPSAVTPLDDIGVLDLSGPAGAYCARLLADLGADVVKVEPPEGDPMRRRPPFRGAAGTEASLLFAAYHANKRGVTLDVSRPDAEEMLWRMARSADVVVLTPNARHPVVGFDRDTGRLRWAREDAVLCVLTPFGLSGPWSHLRATSFTGFAMSAGMSRAGPEEGPPVAMPGQVHWDEAGIHAAVAILAALEARPRWGGQVLDLAAHEVAASKDFLVERYDVEAMAVWGRTVGIGFPPTGTWQCRDGPFEVACHQLHHWDAFLAMLDHPDELSEPSLADPLVRRALFDGVGAVIARIMAPRSRAELFEKGQAAGLPCCPQYTPAEFVRDAQPLARGVFVPMEKPGLGTVTLPWASFASSPPLRVLRRPAPTLGQHNVEIFTAARELPYTAGGVEDAAGGSQSPEATKEGAVAPVSRGPSLATSGLATPTAATPSPATFGSAVHGPLALDGLRVISFGAFIAGNTAAMVLAELGADVVKVEARSRPEVLRTPAYAIGQPFTEPSGVPNTIMYGALSRSTRGLSIDLANPDARPMFHRLVGSADVVLENFAGGTLARWGCAFDDLVTDNPQLVMLSMSGYGHTGPRAGYRAYASTICGYLGLTSAWGYSHGTLSDYVAGTTAALAVLAATRLVRRTGQPVHIDLSQIDAMAALVAPLYLDPLVNGRGHRWGANEVPGSWFAGVFRSAGTDQWVAIELEDAHDWNTLCRFLDRGDLCTDDPSAAASRRSALADEFTEWCESRTSHSAMQLVQRQGLAIGAVYNSEDVWRDPQLRSRGYMLTVDQSDFGPVQYPRPSHQLSRTPAVIRRPPPRLGEHTREVLREWLAIGDDELDRLTGSEAVFQAT